MCHWIVKCKDVSLQTKAEIIHTLVFPLTLHGCEHWTVKKADGKILTHLKYGSRFHNLYKSGQLSRVGLKRKLGSKLENLIPILVSAAK